MASTVKSWASTLNNAFTSAVDQAVQYRESVYALLQQFLAAGWTVERSCDGTNVGAGNQIADASEIVFGTGGAQVFAWFALAAPAGKGNPNGDEYRFLLVASANNTDATPQLTTIYLAHGTYGGGSTTAKPTITGTESPGIAFNACPWVAAKAGGWCAWRTSDGDLYFGVKADSDAFFQAFFILADDPLNGRGHYTMRMRAMANSSAEVLTAANLTANSWINFVESGSYVSAAACSGRCVALAINAWTNGVETSTDAVKRADIEISNNATGNERDLGWLVDAHGCPLDARFGSVDSTDSSAMRYTVIGDLALPTTYSQLPITGSTTTSEPHYYYGAGSGGAVLTITATRIDSTHVRLTFSSPVTDNRALRSTDIYEVTGSVGELTVHSVTIESSTEIVLEHDEEDTDTYTVNVHSVEAA